MYDPLDFIGISCFFGKKNCGDVSGIVGSQVGSRCFYRVNLEALLFFSGAAGEVL